MILVSFAIELGPHEIKHYWHLYYYYYYSVDGIYEKAKQKSNILLSGAASDNLYPEAGSVIIWCPDPGSSQCSTEGSRDETVW